LSPLLLNVSWETAKLEVGIWAGAYRYESLHPKT
jgi:hypothetical protein